jgi:hypothetical protein
MDERDYSDNDHDDDDDDDDDNDDESLTEEEQIAADEQRWKLISMLQRKEQYHKRTRNKMDVLVEEFLTKTKDDIHDMLCDNHVYSKNYDGLDSDRDTEEEVETTIMLFPEVLSRRKEDSLDSYPIQHLASAVDHDRQVMLCNVKAVSFIPILARIAVEHGLFEEEERGGLIIKGLGGCNVIHDLIYTDTEADDDQDHIELVEEKYLIVIKKIETNGSSKERRHSKILPFGGIMCYFYFSLRKIYFVF